MRCLRIQFLNRFASLVLAVFLLLSLWATVAFSVPFISKEYEMEMGQEGDRQVIGQYGIYQNKELQLYVNDLGQKLVSELSNREFPKFYFKIVDDSQINAFALPGGYVYVTRGLLAALNSEAELVGVLGHEIAHVTLHHGAQMMIRSIGAAILSIGGAIASPENAGGWLAVSQAMFSQINLGYGREAELESDAQGLLNAYDAGYNPEGMVHFLGNLRKHQIMTGQSYHSFQATHPDTKDRIVKADLLANSLLRRGDSVVDNRNRYITQLKGLAYGEKKKFPGAGRLGRGGRPSGNLKATAEKYIDVYLVQPGDTWVSIASKELEEEREGMEMAVLNGMRERQDPQPGILIKLVRKGKYIPERKILRLKPEDDDG